MENGERTAEATGRHIFTQTFTSKEKTELNLRMSALRLSLSVVVLMLVVFSLAEGMRGTGPKKCCFRFNNGPINEQRVVSYTKTSQRCSNPAILLRTVAGRELCVRPSDSWVPDFLRRLDAKAGETSPLA